MFNPPPLHESPDTPDGTVPEVEECEMPGAEQLPALARSEGQVGAFVHLRS